MLMGSRIPWEWYVRFREGELRNLPARAQALDSLLYELLEQVNEILHDEGVEEGEWLFFINQYISYEIITEEIEKKEQGEGAEVPVDEMQ